MVEKNAYKTQFELQAQLQVLSAWPIHYACVWVPFVAAFDVLSVGRWWNLQAFRLTTEPHFSPSDSKEFSSWQRFERRTVDEINCGRIMWEEVTLSLPLRGPSKRWSDHRQPQLCRSISGPCEILAPSKCPGHPVTIPGCRGLETWAPAPRSQVLPGASCQILASGFKLHNYDDEAAGGIYRKLRGFHLLPCHLTLCFALLCFSFKDFTQWGS